MSYISCLQKEMTPIWNGLSDAAEQCDLIGLISRICEAVYTFFTATFAWLTQTGLIATDYTQKYDQLPKELNDLLKPYQDLPKKLLACTRDGRAHTFEGLQLIDLDKHYFVSAEMGKKIIENHEGVPGAPGIPRALKKDVIDNIKTCFNNGTILFSILMLRAAIFQPKPIRLAIERGEPVADSPNYFNAPTYFENLNLLIELHNSFWALSPQDMTALIQHVDSEKNQCTLLNEKAWENDPGPALVSQDAANLYSSLQSLASKMIQGHQLFTLTYQMALA